jgi:hypothetical protein
MKYIDYIELGFKRVETNDSIEFNNTGNKSFVLSYEINNELCIEFTMGKRPALYYKHMLLCNLTMEQVKQIINRQYDLK